MRKFSFIFILLIACSTSAQKVTFSKRQLLSDLDYMQKALLELHPGLYRYQPPEQFDSMLSITKKNLDDSISLREAYNRFSRLISGIGCEHTVIVPRANWADTLPKAQFYFPFQIFFIAGEPYLTFNRSSNEDIHPGDKLLSINGRPTKEIVQTIFKHLFSDGYNETLKYQQIHNFMFSYYYNCFIEQTDSFRIQYENANMEVKNATVPALGMKEMSKNTINNPVNKELLQAAQTEKHYSKELLINKKKKVAVIFLRSFFGGKNGMEAHDKLIKFMDRSMEKVKKSKIHDLVIDLRYNSGGYDSQGQILLSYLIKKPVLYYKSMHTITNSSPLLAFSSLTKEDLVKAKHELVKQPNGDYLITTALNNTLDSVRPRPNHFTGNVYFLINGGTGSATAEFTAVAHFLGVGVFIGEESGGNYTGGNGSDYVGLLLPNTKMHLTIPLVFVQNAVDTPSEPGHGTMPDYPVNYKLIDLLKANDAPLNFVYNLIDRKRSIIE